MAYATAAKELWRLFPHSFAQRLGEGRWKAAAHHRLISLCIARAIFANETKIIVVEAPPRHGKSELVSHWLPCWYLSMFPHRRVLLSAYAADFAAEWGEKARNTLNKFYDATGVRVSQDSSARNRWRTEQGGGMETAGVGGQTTGKGAGLFVIDDPIKDAEEADSEVIREKHWNWWMTVPWTRREPGIGTVYVVMHTRWHQDDLAGRILANENLKPFVTRLRFPALAEDENDLLGRKPGDALWPEGISAEGPNGLLALKSGMSARWWNAQFQQSPTSAEGAEIKRHWWRWYDEMPVSRNQLDFVVASWDCAFRDSDGSDYVVGQVWGVYGSYRYLLEQVRDRLDFTATVAAVASIHEKWKPNVTLVEAKANGDAVINTLQAHVPGIVPVEPQGGKESRVRAASPQIEAGNVFLPKTKWAEELVEEAAAFPLGKHDDMVDACSQALNWLLHHKNEHVTHLPSTDARWVPPHILALQKRGVLGLNSALKGRI